MQFVKSMTDLSPHSGQGIGPAVGLDLGFVGQICHCGSHDTLLSGLELDLPLEGLGNDGIDGSLCVCKPEHVGSHNREIDGAKVAHVMAVVEDHVAAWSVDCEGEGKPPVELEREISCPDPNNRDDLQKSFSVLAC